MRRGRKPGKVDYYLFSFDIIISPSRGLSLTGRRCRRRKRIRVVWNQLFTDYNERRRRIV